MTYMLDTYKELLHQLEELVSYANDKEYNIAIGYLMIKCADIEERIKEMENEEK